MTWEKTKEYCKEHETEIIVIGGITIIIAAAVLGVRLHNNKVAEQAATVIANNCVSHDFSQTLPFEVKSHIRKLPDGMHASPMKELTALEHGYMLNPGETWVEAYTKMSKAA